MSLLLSGLCGFWLAMACVELAINDEGGRYGKGASFVIGLVIVVSVGVLAAAAVVGLKAML